MQKKQASTRQIVGQNRKARHNYSIEDTVEAGLVLQGSEVKALREGRVSLGEAYAGEVDGELYLLNAHIGEYAGANRFGHAPKRPRKLLVNRREQNKLLGQVRREGYTLIPLNVYFNKRGLAKLEVGLGKGKRRVDKRETEKKRDWQRQKARLLKDRG